MIIKKTSSRFYTYALIFSGLILTFTLGAIILIGTTSRYMQDDYCYAAILRGNFWQQQVKAYLHETTFSGNRFSLTLFTGISELFGPKFIRILPGTMIVIWLAGLFLFLRQLPFLNEKAWRSRLEVAIICGTLVIFTLGMSTNWVQVYFWRAGMFPYLAPIAFGGWLMYLIAKSLKTLKCRPVWWLGVFLASFLTGGFSEIGAMIELSLLVSCIFIILISKNILKKRIIPFLFALGGSLIALWLVVFSPMNLVRLQTSYDHSSGLVTTLINSFKGGLTFYITTLYRPTLYYVSTLLLFTLLGWNISVRNPKRTLPLKSALFWLTGALIIAYLVTVAAMVPGFYAESSYPSDRALLVPRFISLLLALAIGFLTGNILASLKKPLLASCSLLLLGVTAVFVDVIWLKGMKFQFHPPAFPEMRMILQQYPWLGNAIALPGILIFGILLYKKRIQWIVSLTILLLALPVAFIGARFFTEYPLMKQRADQWDGRETQILQLKDLGNSELVVPAMNSLSGILELSDYEGFWVNHCAAAYYGVDSISAIEPVLDPVQLTNP